MLSRLMFRPFQIRLLRLLQLTLAADPILLNSGVPLKTVSLDTFLPGHRKYAASGKSLPPSSEQHRFLWEDGLDLSLVPHSDG